MGQITKLKEICDGLGVMEEDVVEVVRQLEAENHALKEALTPSSATKAEYMGEFSFKEERFDEEGDSYYVEHYVPWDTIKDIMHAILKRGGGHA